MIGIFDNRERFQATVLLLMMLIGAGFEVLDIGIIVPFIGVLNNPAIIQDNRSLGELYNFLGMDSAQQFMLALGCGLLGVYVIKNTYLGFIAYTQS